MDRECTKCSRNSHPVISEWWEKGYVFLFPFLNIPAFPTLGTRWMNEGITITLTELIKQPERVWPGGPPRSGPGEEQPVGTRGGRGRLRGLWGRKETSPCPTRGVCGVGRGQRKKVHSQFLRDGLSPPSGHPPLVGSQGAQEIRVLSPYLLHENPAMCPGARTGQW